MLPAARRALRSCRVLCLALALAPRRASSASSAPPPPAAPDGSRAASAELAPLAIIRTRLDNGLRIVLSPDHSLPTVAICVIYAVGARDDVGRQSGFALTMQHLMFQGSEHVGKGRHGAWITELGGELSAETTVDRTRYVTLVPAHALELGLWLEADRMQNLDLAKEDLEAQRRAVQEQASAFRLQPYALGQRQLRALVFQDFPPYARDPLGGPEDLLEPIEPSSNTPASALPRPRESAPAEALLARLRRYHDAHYAPNNAVLSVAGDFEIEPTLGWIERYFGGAAEVLLAPPPEGAPSDPSEPRRATLRDPSAPSPALLDGWAIPPLHSADHYALELAKLILGGSASSRLYRQLVIEAGLAQHVEVWTDDHVGPDLFGVRSILLNSADPELVSRITLNQITALGRLGPTAAELERAKNQMRSSFLLELDGNLGRSSVLASFELFSRDAGLVRSELQRYASVTREDVQRAVSRHLRAAQRSEVWVLARRQRPAVTSHSEAASDTSARPEPGPFGAP